MAGESKYRVIFSESLRKRIGGFAEEAKLSGRVGVFDSEMATIVRELEADPESFGDPRHSYEFLKLRMYFAMRGPISIDYGVHETLALVFVQNVNYFPEYDKRDS